MPEGIPTNYVEGMTFTTSSYPEEMVAFLEMIRECQQQGALLPHIRPRFAVQHHSDGKTVYVHPAFRKIARDTRETLENCMEGCGCGSCGRTPETRAYFNRSLLKAWDKLDDNQQGAFLEHFQAEYGFEEGLTIQDVREMMCDGFDPTQAFYMLNDIIA